MYTVLDWINVMKSARPNNPYNIKRLQYADFYDLKDLCSILIVNRNRNSNNEIVNWMMIRSMKFEKGNVKEIFYKMGYDIDWQAIPIRPREGVGCPLAVPHEVKGLYRAVLRINNAKKKDLVEMCRKGIIPSEFHGWYRGIKD